MQLKGDETMSVLDTQLIGMEEQAAINLCKKEGVTVRVASKDGQHFMLTMDYWPARCNLSVVDGKVVSVRHG